MTFSGLDVNTLGNISAETASPGKVVGRTAVPLHFKVKDWINHQPCEIEYYDEQGVVIGYWAYGSYDPDLPYQG